MEPVFRVELLPARHGDCILVEYGNAGEIHRILIDGGPIGAYPALQKRVEALAPAERELELLVITHIDADHIEGAIKLLDRRKLVDFKDIWFNGWPHLDQPSFELRVRDGQGGEQRSPLQGEFASHRIGKRSWNGYFGGGAIFVPEEGWMPRVELPGGLKLTLLSPDVRALRRLRSAWESSLDKLGIGTGNHEEIAGRLRGRSVYRDAEVQQRILDIIDSADDAKGTLDQAVANGSSIAFIAEYAGRSCAFLGDAHMPVVQRSLRRIANEAGAARVRLDAVKLSHHGSRANITKEFLQLVDCRDFLVSTDSSVFNHPDHQTLVRIARQSPGARFHFNYRSAKTGIWAEPELQRRLGCESFFPQRPETGLVFDLLRASA